MWLPNVNSCNQDSRMCKFMQIKQIHVIKIIKCTKNKYKQTSYTKKSLKMKTDTLHNNFKIFKSMKFKNNLKLQNKDIWAVLMDISIKYGPT